jgi:hypothetical protein
MDIDHLGARHLNLARGDARAIRMGVFVPSETIMERLVRAAHLDFREGYLIRAASRLSAGTVTQLEYTLSDPLA